MNCATHSETAAVAFCRTCGKPLCQNCTRDVRGVIYCEACLAERLDGTAPAPGYAPPQPGYTPVPGVPPQAPPQTGYQQFMDQGLGLKVAPGPASGPNPAVAGILAGFFPIGVGAVYTGQFAKGLAHLVIAVLLILGVSSDLPWPVIMMIAIGMGFFYFYQIIDAIRTAKAIQTGQPAPDPFGLAQTFGGGETFEATKVPGGAAVLIGLGLLFLLHTAGLFSFSIDRFWPLILIFLGVWIFAKQWGLIGGLPRACPCERCRVRKVMGPAILVTLGIVFLIGFWHAWPAILLVIGVVKLMQSNATSEGHVNPFPPAVTGMGMPGVPPVSPPPPPSNSGPSSFGGSNFGGSGSVQSSSGQPNPGQSTASGEVNNNV